MHFPIIYKKTSPLFGKVLFISKLFVFLKSFPQKFYVPAVGPKDPTRGTISTQLNTSKFQNYFLSQRFAKETAFGLRVRGTIIIFQCFIPFIFIPLVFPLKHFPRYGPRRGETWCRSRCCCQYYG